MDNYLIKKLSFAYFSAVVIIAILIICAQVIIQYTLAQEVATRGLASTMALQELRTQAVFRNSLLSIIPKDQLSQYTPLTTDPVASLEKNLADVEATNIKLLGPNTPLAVSKDIKDLQPDFQKMNTAGHVVLTNVKGGKLKEAAKQVGILWPPEQKYLQGTYKAYTSLTQDADAYVGVVRVAEVGICLASLAVLIFEMMVVVRPALQNYGKTLRALEAAQEAIQEKEEETL